MNRIINHLVNEFAVKALARNKAFQSFVVRTVDGFKNAGETVTKAAARGSTEAPKAARNRPRRKLEPEIPEASASASSAAPEAKPVDPRDKGFFGHLADVVAKDINDAFGRR